MIYEIVLKPASAIFYQIFVFPPNDSTSKTIKMIFISLKKLFFSQYIQNLFPSFPDSPHSKGLMKME